MNQQGYFMSVKVNISNIVCIKDIVHRFCVYHETFLGSSREGYDHIKKGL